MEIVDEVHPRIPLIDLVDDVPNNNIVELVRRAQELNMNPNFVERVLCHGYQNEVEIAAFFLVTMPQVILDRNEVLAHVHPHQHVALEQNPIVPPQEDDRSTVYNGESDRESLYSEDHYREVFLHLRYVIECN